MLWSSRQDLLGRTCLGTKNSVRGTPVAQGGNPVAFDTVAGLQEDLGAGEQVEVVSG